MKIKKKIKESKKKRVKKYRVHIEEQWRDFTSQDKAREHALNMLKAPITFISLKEVEVDEE